MSRLPIANGSLCGGPSEISYFAQVIPNYSFFGVTSPILFPRSSATIIEQRQLAIIEKFKLSLSDFTYEESALIEKVIKQISEFNFEELFSESEISIKNTLEGLKEKLLTVDVSLAQPIEKSIARIEQTLNTLKDKSKSAEERKHQTVIAQLQKLECC